MSETTSPAPGPPPGDPVGDPVGTAGAPGCSGCGTATRAPAADPVASVEVRDLDARGVLEEVAAARRQADREEARLLALVVAYVDLHPVTDPVTDPLTDPGCEGPVGWPTSRPLVERGVVVEIPLAGVGTPGV